MGLDKSTVSRLLGSLAHRELIADLTADLAAALTTTGTPEHTQENVPA